jgi:predicted PurR-regulated permease PerM
MAFYNFLQRKRVVLIFVLILGAFLLYLSASIIPAFLGSIVCYVLFKRTHVWLIARKKWPAWLSALIIIISSLFLVVLPLYLVVISIIKKAIVYYKILGTNNLQVKQTIGFINQKLQSYFGEDSSIEDFFIKFQGKAIGFLGDALSSTLNFFLLVVLMYFFLYYMLVNYKKFENTLQKFLPFERDDSEDLATELRNVTRSNVIGQTVISIIQGLLLGLGLWIFGFKDPWFWGVLGILVSFIPVIGTPIIFIPAALVAFAQNNSFAAWGILIYGFVIVTNVDYPLRLWLGKKMGDTHPIITILGVLIGIPFFGLIGLVFGPLLISLFILLVKIYERYRLQEKTGEV